MQYIESAANDRHAANTKYTPKYLSLRKNNRTLDTIPNTVRPSSWRLGVVVSVVSRINEVNQHRARLVRDG